MSIFIKKKITRFIKYMNFLPLIELWQYIKFKRKKNIFFLLLIMLASGFSEMITLASVVPFLLIISDPIKLNNLSFISNLLKAFDLKDSNSIIFLITSLFCLAVIIAFIFRLLNIFLSSRIVAEIGSDLSNQLLETELNRSYENYLNSNSSHSINLLTLHISNTVGVINSVLQVTASVIIASFISVTLLLINPSIFISSSIVISSSYFLISKIVGERFIKNSSFISNNTKKQIQIIQEALGNFKDILLNRNQNDILFIYERIDRKVRKRIAQSQFLTNFPKYLIELISIITLVLISLNFTLRQESTNEIITLLGALALAAQRLLPLIQQIYTGWASINNNISSLNKVNKALFKNKYIKNGEVLLRSIKFEKRITFRDISFKYLNDNKYVLHNLNLEIIKGQSLGIVGSTGSGKSTFIDLLMGLIYPTSGEIFIDDVNIADLSNSGQLKFWQSMISHVPQKIYLFDSSFAENIANKIGLDKLDMKKIRKAAKRSYISEIIESSLNGFLTKVGERGLKISGGELQRIGLARAFYKDHKILILDEATSALDNRTEDLVMKSLYEAKDDITLIIVAHRLRTLKKCDQIIELKNGLINWTGTSNAFFNLKNDSNDFE